MSTEVVSLAIDEPGALADAAYARLKEELGDAQVEEPEPETGVFDVTLEAESRDAALLRVWDAIAAAGADDEILFIEHSDIPEHWRTRPA